MPETVILEDYSTNNNLTNKKKRHSFRKFFQWNAEKYNKNDDTVEKINSIYKANNSTTVGSKRQKSSRSFYHFLEKIINQILKMLLLMTMKFVRIVVLDFL